MIPIFPNDVLPFLPEWARSMKIRKFTSRPLRCWCHRKDCKWERRFPYRGRRQCFMNEWRRKTQRMLLGKTNC